MYEEVETLLLEIAAGEDTYLELEEVRFKGNQVQLGNEEGKAAAKLAGVFCSLANAEGGVVVFGVRDDRSIMGVDPARQNLLEQFTVNVALSNCKPLIEPILNWIQLPDETGNPRLCLKVDIRKSRYYVHQTIDGRFLKRIGSHRHPIPAEQLGRMLSARNLVMPFEEQPALGASIEMIDRDRVESYYRRRFKHTLEAEQLMFHQVLHYFQTSPLIAVVSSKESTGRRDLPAYVDTALQEALVNAVVHRDYQLTGSQIIIRHFPHRLEIQNPGGLHNTLTEENLYAGCQPIRRNQQLAGFMRDYESPITGTSFMEARGEGFLNLVRDSIAISGKRPEIKRIGEAVKLTIFAATYHQD